MLPKTIVAALLATSAVALPAKTARDTTPDYILNPMTIDEHNRPDTPEKRDPNSVVNFWTPSVDGEEETADLDKRFYIYHRPPTPGAESVEKRDPNSLVKFYIPDAPTSDAEEGEALDKRFYIYHRPPTPGAESIEKRDRNSLNNV